MKNENEVKPTWLYIKRHSISGLKYFGCTTKYRAKNYDGSGTKWSNHIKKHGRKFVVTDLVIGPYTNKEELTNLALWMSEKMDIVKSDEWANQMVENGLAINGCVKKGYKQTDEHKRNNSIAHKGKPSGRKGMKLEDFCSNPEKARENFSKIRLGAKSEKKGKTLIELYGEEKANEISNKITIAKLGKPSKKKGIKTGPNPGSSMANKGKTSPNKGKTLIEIYGEEKANEISNKMSKSRKGIPNPGISAAQKGKPNPAHSERMKGRIPWNKGLKKIR